MTTKANIDEFFNLPPLPIEESKEVKLDKNDIMAEAKLIYSSLTTAEKIDNALTSVTGLDSTDTEMDDISSRALKTYGDLVSLGINASDMYAGKIFEVSGQMLKIALEAKIAKTDKKLRMIELQLKKARLEQTVPDADRDPNKNMPEFDRNEILRHIVENSKPKIE
jgi:hypothetical protein